MSMTRGLTNFHTMVQNITMRGPTGRVVTLEKKLEERGEGRGGRRRGEGEGEGEGGGEGEGEGGGEGEGEEHTNKMLKQRRVGKGTCKRNKMIITNPRRAGTARVTVLGLCVCLFACLFVYNYSRTTGY